MKLLYVTTFDEIQEARKGHEWEDWSPFGHPDQTILSEAVLHYYGQQEDKDTYRTDKDVYLRCEFTMGLVAPTVEVHLLGEFGVLAEYVCDSGSPLSVYELEDPLHRLVRLPRSPDGQYQLDLYAKLELL